MARDDWYRNVKWDSEIEEAFFSKLKRAGDAEEARPHARNAIEAAERDHSGFRYHSNLGLVGDSYSQIRKRLAELAA